MSSIDQKKWLKLGQNERVLWWAHPSIVRYFPVIALAGILMLSGLVLPFVEAINFEAVHPELRLYMFLLIPIGLGLVLAELIQRKYTYYVITTDKIWIKSGIIATTRDPIRFDRLVNNRVHRPALETIISWIIPSQDIGHIELNTADDNLGDLYMKDVPDVEIASDLVEEGMEKANQSQGFNSGNFTENQNQQYQQQGQQPQQPPQGQQQQQGQQPQQPPQGQPPTGGTQGGSNGQSRYPDK